VTDPTPQPSAPQLFTAGFFLMWSFSFTVFLSAFMLLPTAPFHILATGGSRVSAGLFLGFLTYASALSAPITGAIADRVGKRSMLILCSLAIAGFSVAYGVSHDYRVPLALVVLHGVFWSGLLAASAAHMTDLIPEGRRAEGIAYWGLASVLAIALAPATGFWLYAHGWSFVCGVSALLNLVMAAIAWSLRETSVRAFMGPERSLAHLIEWRILLASFALFLYSFGYGGITSFIAVYADAQGVHPKEIFFTTFAGVVLLTRPVLGPLADRVGHKRIFYPCLLLIVAGLSLLTRAPTRSSLMLAALVFGSGFGTAYPVFVAYVMHHVPPARRGAAFGGILAAFDVGVGTGSIGIGWISQQFGFPAAFGTAALLSALSAPYFYFADRRWLAPAPDAARPRGDAAT